MTTLLQVCDIPGGQLGALIAESPTIECTGPVRLPGRITQGESDGFMLDANGAFVFVVVVPPIALPR